MTKYLKGDNPAEGIRLQASGFVSFHHLCKAKGLQHFTPDEVRFVGWTAKVLCTVMFIHRRKYLDYHTYRSVFHLERSKGKESIRLQTPRNSLSNDPSEKRWFGVAAGSTQAYKALKSAATFVGNKNFSAPHLTFGWCSTSDEFWTYASSFGIEEKLHQLISLMAKEFYFLSDGFEYIGRDEDKVAVLFSPKRLDNGSADEARHLQFDFNFKLLWRKAGRMMAKERNQKFFYFTNHTGELEYGEVGGKLIYEMRNIKPKYHITLGRAPGIAESLLASQLGEVKILIDPDTFYMDSGAPGILKIGI